jgi:malonate decarboxylase gamma subunit
MDWQTLASALFPQGHTITEQDQFLSGQAQVDAETVAVIGTTGHAPIGIEIALAQARAVLDTVRQYPGRAIVLLVDTQGQRLRHRDEMLGINSYMAHLGKCVDLARRRGHQIIGLVYDQALSGGFITSGLMADACYALPASTIRVMALPAMARITKVPEETLTELARSNPVFAPGPENYLRMGGLQAIWDGDLAAQMVAALRDGAGQGGDKRATLGLERGGRKLAQPVIDAILGGRNVQTS